MSMISVILMHGCQYLNLIFHGFKGIAF